MPEERPCVKTLFSEISGWLGARWFLGTPGLGGRAWSLRLRSPAPVPGWWGLHDAGVCVGHAFAVAPGGGGMELFGLGQDWAQSHKSATPAVGAMPIPSSQSPDRVRQSRCLGRSEAPDLTVS
jgi:hypothetical protein